MRLLFIMAQPYFPHGTGGVQTVTRTLVQALAARGHAPAVAAVLSFKHGAGVRAAAGLLLSGGRFSRETYDGAPVFRARHIRARIGAILNAHRPDCVIVQSRDAMPLAHAVNLRAIPLVVCWHDVDLQRMGGTPQGLTARFVANSRFTAETYQDAFGVTSTVIPPIIQRELYETNEAHRNQITFVNPVADKGLDLAIDIAKACPDIPFEFVESWMLTPDAKQALFTRLEGLSNVTFTPHQNSMRPVYGRTCILLAPSQWQEAWGRVASEAHISGIPVIGSQIGGLVESVGPGGILLPPDAPLQSWIGAVRNLWDNAEHYAELSTLARKYAQRQELDQGWAVEAMLAEIAAAMAMRH